jgi:hypothetical protein
VDYFLSPTHLRVVAELGESKCRWEYLEKVEHWPNGWLLTLADGRCWFLPEDQVTPPLEELILSRAQEMGANVVARAKNAIGKKSIRWLKSYADADDLDDV